MRRALVLSAALLLAACGGSAPNRPVIVSTTPTNGAVLAGLIDSVRITYDEPVWILNPAQISGSLDGLELPLVPAVDPADSTSVIAVPAAGFAFAPGFVQVRISPGLVVNADDQYRLEDVDISFTIGAGPTAPGAPR